MFNLFKVLGLQSNTQQGRPIGEIHLDAQALIVNRMLAIKEIAAAYTVLITDTGKVLVVTAAVTITLPTPTAAMEGMFVDIYNGADNSVTVATQTADTLVTMNDIAADSVAWSTSSEKIGAAGRFFVHGSKWYHANWTEEAQTVTVAT